MWIRKAASVITNYKVSPWIKEQIFSNFIKLCSSNDPLLYLFFTCLIEYMKDDKIIEEFISNIGIVIFYIFQIFADVKDMVL